MFKNTGVAFRNSFYNTEIFFFKLSVLDFVVKYTEGCGVFCRNYNSAGVSVNTVAKSRDKRIFFLRVIFLFLVKIVLKPCDKSIRTPIVSLMDKKPGGFVYQQDVFVFINNING